MIVERSCEGSRDGCDNDVQKLFIELKHAFTEVLNGEEKVLTVAVQEGSEHGRIHTLNPCNLFENADDIFLKSLPVQRCFMDVGHKYSSL